MSEKCPKCGAEKDYVDTQRHQVRYGCSTVFMNGSLLYYGYACLQAQLAAAQAENESLRRQVRAALDDHADALSRAEKAEAENRNLRAACWRAMATEGGE